MTSLEPLRRLAGQIMGFPIGLSDVRIKIDRTGEFSAKDVCLAEVVNDLPNPLDPPAPSSKSADDLVAQLAEKAIDQMLAEKEIDRPTAGASGSGLQDVIIPDITARDLTARDITGPDLERPESAVEAQTDSMQAQLDSLLSDVTSSLPNPSPDADASDTGASDTGATDAGATDTGAPQFAFSEPASILTDSAADSANPADDATFQAIADSATQEGVESTPLPGRLNQNEVDDLVSNYKPDPRESIAQAQSDVQALLHDIEPAGSAGAGVVVTVLEILNKPFQFISPGVRDALGLVAILTLINALAVLGYVMYIRWK